MLRETGAIRTAARADGAYDTGALLKLSDGVAVLVGSVERRGAELRDSRGEDQREYKKPRPRL